MKPDIRTTWNDGFALAYQIVGSGRHDLVYLPGWVSHLDMMWDIPPYRRFIERLAALSRLIVLDRRGVGCADRLPPGDAPALEEIADDILAVMEAASSMHATLFATQEAVFPALLLAASHPHRVRRLVLFGASPSWKRSEDLPDEWSPERWDSELRAWGRTTSAIEGASGYVRFAAPSLYGDDEATRALGGLLLSSQGLGASISEARMWSMTDLRQILPSIQAPTLVLRREGDELIAESSSRYLAEHLPSGEYVRLPGADVLPWIGDQEPVLETMERFMGVEPGPPASDRRLASVLFTDIVESTVVASELGDGAWKGLLEEHHRLVREQLTAQGGVEVDTAGDGFFAVFDGPARAIRCAMETAGSVSRSLGFEIRAGVHTGEVETIAGKPGGAAVVIGARIAASAGASEVLVSQTVKDLTAGSELTFEDLGERRLKGITDPWHLYRVKERP